MILITITRLFLAIRQRSRWQRASILTPRACNNKISPSKRADLPSDAFCASVHSQGTVVKYVFFCNDYVHKKIFEISTLANDHFPLSIL